MLAKAGLILFKLGGILTIFGAVSFALIWSGVVSSGFCTGALPGAIFYLGIEMGFTYGAILLGLGWTVRVLTRKSRHAVEGLPEQN